jgi:hypothetical protein
MVQRRVDLRDAEYQARDVGRSPNGGLTISLPMRSVGVLSMVSFSAGISSFGHVLQAFL